MANATPDGIHFVYQASRRAAYALNPATTENSAAKEIMNSPLFSGSWPSPGARFLVSKLCASEIEDTYEEDEPARAIHTP